MLTLHRVAKESLRPNRLHTDPHATVNILHPSRTRIFERVSVVFFPLSTTAIVSVPRGRSRRIVTVRCFEAVKAESLGQKRVRHQCAAILGAENHMISLHLHSLPTTPSQRFSDWLTIDDTRGRSPGLHSASRAFEGSATWINHITALHSPCWCCRYYSSPDEQERYRVHYFLK